MKRHLATSMFFSLLALAVPAQAQLHPFVETDRVEMPELEPNAPVDGKLGAEVAMSGRTVFAGAAQAFDWDGAVFVFELDDNGILQFRQRLQTESDTYKFGQQLAVDGEWAAVGQSGNRVRLYQRSGTSWVQRQLIELSNVPPTPGIEVRSVSGDLALSGDLLAIGDDSGRVTSGGNVLNAAGVVVLFRRNAAGQWLHEATVSSSQPVANARLGSAVAVSGNTLLAGASGQGSATIFQRSGSQWQFVRHLAPPVPAGASFGWSVALDGDVAVVGRRSGLAGDGLPTNIGSFRAYERNLGGAGQWGLRGEYISSQPGYLDNFSASLSLRGGVLLVGSPGTADRKRAMYFVHRPGVGFEEKAILKLEDTGDAYGNQPDFGAAVAFSGLRAVIGAPRSPDVGGARWGSIHAWTSPSGGAVGGECENAPNPFDVIFCNGFE